MKNDLKKLCFVTFIITALLGTIYYYKFIPSNTGGVRSNSQLASLSGASSGLLVHYSFEESSGTTLTDTSGNGNNATLVNGPTQVTGKIGQAVSFDGTDDTISLGSTASLANIETQGGGMSIAFWINPTSYGNSSVGAIFRKPNNYSAGFWTLRFDTSSSELNFLKDFDGTDLNIRSPGDMIPPLNTWTHIVMTWDGTANASGVTFYSNGVYKGRTGSNASGNPVSDNANNLTINGIQGSTIWPGLLDDVRIYNRMITADEVFDLYNYSSIPGPTVSPTPTPEPSIIPTVVPTAIPTVTPDPTPEPSVTVAPTAEPTPTAEPSPTITPQVTDIIPVDRRIEWNPGISENIPNRPLSGGQVIDVKSMYSAVGDGVADDTVAIQRAIDDASNGDVIYLPAGTYKITSAIYLSKGVVLRGAGSSSQILIYGSSIGIKMGKKYSSFGPAVSLSGSYSKGSYQVNLAQEASISPGQYVIVDELNPAAIDTTSGSYLCEDRSGGTYKAGERCISQIVQVAEKNGLAITFNHPLYFDYDAALNPRIYVVNMVRQVGLENLYIKRAENVGNGTSNIINMFECAECWVKGVETHYGRGDHINMNFTYGSVIRDSYVHMGHNDYGVNSSFDNFGVNGGESYGVSFTGFGYDSGRNYGIHLAWGPNSDNLIENNIVNSTRHGIIIEGPGNGNVIAYNYVLNGVVYNSLGWNTSSLSNHGVHPYMNLWEGNISDRLGFDYTHGSGSHNTIFRNRLTSGPAWKNGGIWAIDLQQKQWYVNVVGNVLGSPERQNCSYDAGNTNACAIYRLGHKSDGAGTISDPNTSATLLRWGNFDYINNSVLWNAAERPDGLFVSHNLPASLYLSSKPSWFKNVAWPPIGPDPNNPSLVIQAEIPAKQCFDKIKLAQSASFDPYECYGDVIISPSIPSGGGSGAGAQSGGGGAGSSNTPSPQGIFTPTVPRGVGGGFTSSGNGGGGPCTPTYASSTLPALPAYAAVLRMGSRGANVSALQSLLVSRGYLANDLVTGYYGILTQAAVSRYNTARNTRVQVTFCPTGNIPSGAATSRLPASFRFTVPMKLGMASALVRNLQIFLNDRGFTVSSAGAGSKGLESTYFGPATLKALIKFQESYSAEILAPNGLVKGTGYFGASTMKKVNELLMSAH